MDAAPPQRGDQGQDAIPPAPSPMPVDSKTPEPLADQGAHTDDMTRPMDGGPMLTDSGDAAVVDASAPLPNADMMPDMGPPPLEDAEPRLLDATGGDVGTFDAALRPDQTPDAE